MIFLAFWLIISILVVIALIFAIRKRLNDGNEALPPHLKGKKHNDYIFPFCYLPRALTSYKWRQPPKLLKGYNVNNYTTYQGTPGPDPIQRTLMGKKNAWQVCLPLFFEITLCNGWYFYIGARWDAADFYYTFPACDISKAEKFQP